MKKKLVAAIVAGIIAFGTAGYLYDQMYDCLFPPLWMKLPRSYSIGDCLQMYADGTLLDYTKARENYAEKQAHRAEMIDKFKDRPEVVAFYDKYDDANVSVGDYQVSYFAGGEAGFKVRMNFFLDDDYKLDYIEFHCFVGREHQTQVAQEDILNYLKNYDCGKKSLKSKPEPETKSTLCEPTDYEKTRKCLEYYHCSVDENPALNEDCIDTDRGISTREMCANPDNIIIQKSNGCMVLPMVDVKACGSKYACPQMP